MLNFASIQRYLAMSLVFLTILAVTAFYFVPHGQAHNFPTYLIAIVVLATPAFWRTAMSVRHYPSWLFSILLPGYLAVSTFWSPARDGGELVSRFGDFALLVTFLAALSLSDQYDRRYFHWLFVTLVLVAAVTGVLSVGSHVAHNGLDTLAFKHPPLSGWGGRLENAVIAGLAYAAASQLTFGMALTTTQRLPRLSYWLAFVLLSWVTLLTQSRGPTIALVIGIATLLAVQYSRVKATRIIPLLLGLTAIATATLYGVTKMDPAPADYSPTALEQSLVNDNPDLNLGADHLRAVYTDPDNIRMAEPGILMLAGDRDPSGGALWPAFRIDNQASYFIDLRVKASRQTGRGFAVRVEEFDGVSPGGTHVAPNAGHGLTAASRQVTGLVERWKLDDNWQRFVVEYNPTSQARWAGILLMHGQEIGDAAIFVDHLKVYRLEPGPFETTRAGRLILGSLDPRDLIWTRTLDRTLTTAPWLGAGIATDEGITPRDGLTYQHAHSIYLSTLHYGGLVGLGLLLALLVSLNRDIGRLPASRERTVAFGLLIFALTALAVDGGRILTKIDHLWLVFWMPVGIFTALRARSDASSAR